MRISRGDEVIGEWSLVAIKRRLADGSLVPTDLYYDEDASDWLPLSSLLSKLAAPKPSSVAGRSCYCGSNLPFAICHGDGSQY